MNAEKLITPKDKVRQLQRKLYLSAKMSSSRRFHALYDKVYREDILYRAWREVCRNKGSTGIDKQSIEDAQWYGVGKLIAEIQEELKTNSYQPQPVKRVYIPKADGKKRPLGIPTVKDRIVQTATKIVVELIFEADFKECSYGFRPKRNAHQALEDIRKACNNKGMYVLDADISSYFDNINHEKLLMLVEKRISDRRVVKLIRYCDDFVIVCKSHKKVSHAYSAIKLILGKLELEMNPQKTRIVSLWGGKEGFDFLGYHNRQVPMETKSGREYWALEQWISKKAEKRIKEVVKKELNNATTYMDLKYVIQKLNRKIVGWRNYYGRSPVRVLLRLDRYITMRLVSWYNKKKQRRKRKSFYELARTFRDIGLKWVAFAS